MRTTYWKSCVPNLLLVSDLTLDPSFKVKCGFYPTALKCCRGIVFTHGVWMGSLAGGLREKICPGCTSETITCRKLILGRDIG